jgi:hypothetical protein
VIRHDLFLAADAPEVAIRDLEIISRRYRRILADNLVPRAPCLMSSRTLIRAPTFITGERYTVNAELDMSALETLTAHLSSRPVSDRRFAYGTDSADVGGVFRFSTFSNIVRLK